MSHDVVEVIRCNKTILIEICLAENVIELIISQILTQFFGDFLQLVDGDFALSL
jgi:hypothetical protein